MPIRCRNLISLTFGGLACAILLSAANAGAQTRSELPLAPERQIAEQAATPLLPAWQENSDTSKAGDPPSADAKTDDQSGDAPVLTMAPHSENARYWVSGQANSIFQMHGHFRSPYEGPNSLIDDFETKASEVATLYLGYEWHANT